MATTVQDIITSARYDLRDHGSQKFDDTQLVDYVNRIITLLDRLLLTKHSDFTMAIADVALASGDYTSTAPTRSHFIESIYYESTLLIKEPLVEVMYRYQMNDQSSSTGVPTYWAYNNGSIFFNVESDDNYTLQAHYHVRTATLTIVDNLPYNDFFNEYIREALVVMASKSKDDKIVQVDMQFYTLFKGAVNDAVIGRNWTAKKYMGF